MLSIYSVLGNSQKLDGGAMFGNAPRALWSRLCPPDELGRIDLMCRACLVDDGKRRILLETGIGAFFEPALRERYGVVEPEHVLLRSLAALGLSDSEIDAVVLSHLHFDHAGGLLAPYQAGAAPRLLFPKATFIVGSAAYERAVKPHARDRASFVPELPALLEQSGRLQIVKDDAQAQTLLGPQFTFRQTFGHTVGMLHTLIRGTKAQVFFAADLIPGGAWVHLPMTMGYDRFPELLIEEKTALYAELEPQHGYLFFTHDAKIAVGRIERSATGKYQIEEPTPHVCGWDLDTDPAPPVN